MSWSVPDKYKEICSGGDEATHEIKFATSRATIKSAENRQFCKDLKPPDAVGLFSSSGSALKTQAALLKSKQWDQHKKLRIKFIGGTKEQRDWVINVAERTFIPLMNLKFEWLDDQDPMLSEIRISFDPNIGSWSYLGTDCLDFKQSEATMNIAWFDYPPKDGGVIKHEFGHCIGPWIHVCA